MSCLYQLVAASCVSSGKSCACTRPGASPCRLAADLAHPQGELAVVDRAPTSASYARVDFHPECEAAINEQIK